LRMSIENMKEELIWLGGNAKECVGRHDLQARLQEARAAQPDDEKVLMQWQEKEKLQAGEMSIEDMKEELIWLGGNAKECG